MQNYSDTQKPKANKKIDFFSGLEFTVEQEIKKLHQFLQSLLT